MTDSFSGRSSVLVVDDERAIRSLLVDGLSRAGFSVSAACDAQEALEVLEEHPPDAVLLDIMLPGTSGLELAQIIHDRWPIFIIAMSASQTMLDRACLLPCVNETVQKPFEWEVLLADLHRGAATRAHS